MDSVGAYLKTIGKIPRLTHEETLALAVQVQRGIEAERFQAWNQANPNAQWLFEMPAEEIFAQCRKRIAIGKRAQKKLTEANLRLAFKKASQYKHMDLPLEDRVQAANEGLMEAVKRFNPYLGWRFATFACWWIYESVSRQNTYTGKMIRIPHTALRLYSQLTKCRTAILFRGERATYRAIAAEYTQTYGKAITPERCKAGLMVNRQVSSLDVQHGTEADGCTLEELLPDPDTLNPYAGLESAEIAAAVEAGLEYIDLYPDPRGEVVREVFLNGRKSRDVAASMGRHRNAVEELTHKGLNQMARRPEIRSLKV